MEYITEEDYYVKVFEKLQTENKDTWNWGACIFGFVWMLYRKLYLYGFLFSLILVFFALVSVKVLAVDGVFKFLICITVYMVLSSVITGFYGNRLCYRIVKKRIKEGYHLLERYHPTSYSLCAAFLVGVGSFLAIFIYALGDFFAIDSKKAFEEKDTEINEKNIRALLTRSDKDHTPGRVSKVIFWSLATLVTILSLI